MCAMLLKLYSADALVAEEMPLGKIACNSACNFTCKFACRIASHKKRAAKLDNLEVLEALTVLK
jgi:hypothetical protein